MQKLVNLIRHDDEPMLLAELSQFPPTFAAERATAGIVVAGNCVQQGRAVFLELFAQDIGSHTVSIHGDADHVQPMIGEDAVRQEIGRLLDKYSIALLRELAADEIKSLRVTATDDQ